ANFAITTQHGAFAYGGMPAIMSKGTHEEKGKYLKDLFEKTYIADIVERHRMLNDKAVLEVLLDFISAAVGSLTNAAKLSKTFDGVKHVKIAPQTVSAYLDYFVDAFLVSKSYRYDIKGKRRMGSPWKCYFADVGLRNARLNFRRQEENRVMENIMYNELAAREYDIDVGSVEYNFKRAGKSQRAQLEVDFVANKGSKRYYIQSAPTVAEEEKRMRETNPLNRISDSFKKIVVVKDDMIPWHDENGVLYVAVTQFLLDEEAMDI
ncbi:MAG: DUF4143 domain-containing protein, partial [Deltaproteobacteria bacterium]|nr:DUF4143 domain-containing protein [Deltaproteobacteria bacterium]